MKWNCLNQRPRWTDCFRRINVQNITEAKAHIDQSAFCFEHTSNSERISKKRDQNTRATFAHTIACVYIMNRMQWMWASERKRAASAQRERDSKTALILAALFYRTRVALSDPPICFVHWTLSTERFRSCIAFVPPLNVYSHTNILLALSISLTYSHLVAQERQRQPTNRLYPHSHT